MSLLYYIDIGNTRAKFWACNERGEFAREAIAHNGHVDDVVTKLSAHFPAPDGIFVASVLGESAEQSLTQCCMHVWGIAPHYARSSWQHQGVTNAYGKGAATLGVDRWLALIAVKNTEHDVCVLDCGTAITLDVLQRDGQHLGGYILPGLALMQHSLCAGVQGIKINQSPESNTMLGTTTGEAVTHGALAAVVALLERVACEYAPIRIVLTGGDASRISSCLNMPHECAPDLLLEGLQRYFADAAIK